KRASISRRRAPDTHVARRSARETRCLVVAVLRADERRTDIARRALVGSLLRGRRALHCIRVEARGCQHGPLGSSSEPSARPVLPREGAPLTCRSTRVHHAVSTNRWARL